jgi:pyridoxal phosphate enzyme (YggS family)
MFRKRTHFLFLREVPPFDSAIRDRLAIAQDRIAAACSRSGRAAAAVTLVAVTKGFPQSVVRKAYALGLQHVGENRVQELTDKFGDGVLIRECPKLKLHLVGHLQSNKVRKAVQCVSSIDSLDSLRLAEIVDREAARAGKRVRVLLEVNTSGELQKFGLPPEDVLLCAEASMRMPHLDLSGLMTVGPLTDDAVEIRRSFALLREVFEKVSASLRPPTWSVLSMGMSQDFEIAIEEGATEIRLGTALFGERSMP